MVALLEARGVTKRYGRTTALEDVSFDLDAGKVLALIGANGAGKTTLIKCMLGLIRFEGTVQVQGQDVARDGAKARRAIGYLPQNPALHPDLTVRETALFYARLKGASNEEARDLVESVGLGTHAEKRADELSGGMRQRLALAIALLADPALLVLDEPGAGLDISARLELRHLVQEQRGRGKAVVLSTHWVEDVPYVADEVLLLDHGQVRSLGPASSVVATATPEARLYLRLDGQSSEAVPLIGLAIPGSAVDRTGDWLVVTCAAMQKARVVEALVQAGITILDLRVEEATARSLIPQSEREGMSL
jgi:ABC-type multidrug transport system ATPase subunit